MALACLKRTCSETEGDMHFCLVVSRQPLHQKNQKPKEEPIALAHAMDLWDMDKRVETSKAISKSYIKPDTSLNG